MTLLVLVLTALLKLSDGRPIPQQTMPISLVGATPAGALSQMLVNLLNYKLQWLSQFTGAVPGGTPLLQCPPLLSPAAGTAPPPPTAAPTAADKASEGEKTSAGGQAPAAGVPPYPGTSAPTTPAPIAPAPGTPGVSDAVTTTSAPSPAPAQENGLDAY